MTYNTNTTHWYCNATLALYFTIYNVAKLCTEIVYAFQIILLLPKDGHKYVITEGSRNDSLFMDKCKLLVVHSFMCISWTGDVQY